MEMKLDNQKLNNAVLHELCWIFVEFQEEDSTGYVRTVQQVTKPSGVVVYWNKDDKEMELPDYANDLRWAMDLLLVHLNPPSAKFEIVADSVGSVWVNISWGDKQSEGFTTDPVSNLAQLICMVWLRWMDKDVFDNNVKVINI